MPELRVVVPHLPSLIPHTGGVPHSRPDITPAEVAAVQEVLRSGMLASGERVRQFEGAVQAAVGAPHCHVTTSGTAALELALRALRLRGRAEIVMPTYVCRNVREAVLACGFTPVFCDIGPSWTVTADAVAPHIREGTGAVIVVHTFGIAADVRSIQSFGVPVVEDACQTFGLTIEGKTAGTIADVGVYSFHATKLLCAAEGGAVVTSRRDLSNRMRSLTNDNAATRMSDIHAALGLSQLSRYPSMLARRRELAEAYFGGLAGLGSALPWGVRDSNVFFRFPIRLCSPGFERARGALGRDGIQVRRGVDALLHRDESLPDEAFPSATALFEDTLSIPLYPSLTDDEHRRVVEAVLRLAA